jgi:hypothetical protein
MNKAIIIGKLHEIVEANPGGSNRPSLYSDNR